MKKDAFYVKRTPIWLAIVSKTPITRPSSLIGSQNLMSFNFEKSFLLCNLVETIICQTQEKAAEKNGKYLLPVLHKFCILKKHRTGLFVNFGVEKAGEVQLFR